MRNMSYGFDIYLVKVKTIRQILAFLEKLNFKNNLKYLEVSKKSSDFVIFL